MERRIKIEYKFEPGQGDERAPITEFGLWAIRSPERRREGGRWLKDEAHEMWPARRELVATMTRREVSELIADGADWLAYLPELDG